MAIQKQKKNCEKHFISFRTHSFISQQQILQNQPYGLRYEYSGRRRHTKCEEKRSKKMFPLI
ncbi:hypothetical protein DERP_005065 [Dermatophagoides pteronyssinus]|uniref:Uncharacterized protein n=1 Tax=Dermatophagoides pteronyssinus TaxID=6956 RepID=A0ABQ8JU72_DERPT|nr:hypothetical protein DERP_005065 [Dermatophagoides pteronyssinus]